MASKGSKLQHYLPTGSLLSQRWEGKWTEVPCVQAFPALYQTLLCAASVWGVTQYSRHSRQSLLSLPNSQGSWATTLSRLLGHPASLCPSTSSVTSGKRPEPQRPNPGWGKVYPLRKWQARRDKQRTRPSLTHSAQCRQRLGGFLKTVVNLWKGFSL